MLNDELTIPRSMSIADVHAEWVPLGMPWWKPSEEIVGDLKAIASGLNNPQRIAKERGTGDVFDNIDQTIAVIKHARDKGIELLGEPFNLNFDVQFPAPTLDAKA
jgi:capsid protein